MKNHSFVVENVSVRNYQLLVLNFWKLEVAQVVMVPDLQNQPRDILVSFLAKINEESVHHYLKSRALN